LEVIWKMFCIFRVASFSQSAVISDSKCCKFSAVLANDDTCRALKTFRRAAFRTSLFKSVKTSHGCVAWAGRGGFKEYGHCAVADEALAIWSSEAPDENQ